MQKLTGQIAGADQSVLADAIKRELPGMNQYRTQKVLVCTFEKYFLRVSHNVLSVVVFDFSDPATCNMLVIIGGGASGLIGFDWGSESSVTGDLRRLLERVCTAHGWQLHLN